MTHILSSNMTFYNLDNNTISIILNYLNNDMYLQIIINKNILEIYLKLSKNKKTSNYYNFCETLELYKYAFDNTPIIYDYPYFTVRNIDCLQYEINVLKKSINDKTWDNTMRLGTVACAKYLSEFKYDKFIKKGCNKAALYGNLEILKFGYNTGWPCIKGVCTNAIRNGHINCVKFLYEAGYIFTDDHTTTAAEIGDFECFEYLHKIGAPINEEASYYAAVAGAIKILQYIRENDLPWSSIALEEAAEYGQLESVKFILDNGCPFEPITMEEYHYIKGNSRKCSEYIRDSVGIVY